MPHYHIALAEDHIMIRETIKKCIEEVPGLQVVVELSDGTEVLEFLKHSVPDMLILDLHMPQLNGIEATKIIKSLYPEIKILILTMHKSKVHFGQAFKAGQNPYFAWRQNNIIRKKGFNWEDRGKGLWMDREELRIMNYESWIKKRKN